MFGYYQKFCFATLAFFTLIVNISYAMRKPLIKEELSQLNKGEIIVRRYEKKKAPWPVFELIALTKVSPLTGISVFAAYEHQRDYVPNVIKSKVVSESRPGVVAVSYELKTPWPIPNSKYINLHYLSKKDQTYKVRWKQLESSSTEKSQGFAEFRPFEGQTLLIYESFIHPHSFLASAIESIAEKDLLKTIKAILRYTEKLDNDESELLAMFEDKVKDSLNGKKVYLK